MKKRDTLTHIFKNVIMAENNCIVCTLPKTVYGYVRLSHNGKRDYAHRVVYRHFKGEIPEKYVVMHSCDNTLCCNPNHLSVGTIRDNVYDSINKGRHITAGKSIVFINGVCKNGHSESENEAKWKRAENTNGIVIKCRKCHAIASLKSYHKRQAINKATGD